MKACVFFAEGFEEVEALTVVDLLRRAGVETDMVSVSGEYFVTGRSKITVKADVLYGEAAPEEADMLILPGGMPGVTNLLAFSPLVELLKKGVKEGKELAAICAAPMILGRLGLLGGRRATIYPGMEAELAGAVALSEEVVRDGNITTSRGVGTAIPFALSLIETLCGKEAAENVKKGIVFKQADVIY